MKEIIEARPIMLGIDLENPFPLGFGTLETLPRVLYLVSALDKEHQLTGIGEASIDFPFSPYDAYDIYHTLNEIDIKGRSALDREAILTDNTIRSVVLDSCPAAFHALNMAIDDLFGQLEKQSITDLYGAVRKDGKALASISFQPETNILLQLVDKELKLGFIPKPKVGKNIEKDIKTIQTVHQFLKSRGGYCVLDFNGQYAPEEFCNLIDDLITAGCRMDHILFLEQPTREENGIEGLSKVKQYLMEKEIDIPIIADESFVSIDDALECACRGISLNFKLNKVGGLFHARTMEDAFIELMKNRIQNMLGGTFPTAIGRVYDQQAGAILPTASLPSDGWMPSSWFEGQKHLIKEQFTQNPNGNFKPMSGFGLGAIPDWDKIKTFEINNPKQEYERVRCDLDGSRLRIKLKDNQTYKTVYQQRSGRSFDWNL